MKTTVAAYLGLVSYLTVTAIPIVLFDVDMWLSITVLLGAPILFFGWCLHPDVRQVSAIAAFAATHAFLWQLLGHSTGAWYEVSVLPFHVIGFVPLESLWFSFVVSTFTIFAYEYFVDDAYIDSFCWTRHRLLVALALGVAALGGVLYGIFVSSFYVPYAFALATLLLLGLGGLIFLRGIRGDARLLEKLVIAVVVLAPLLTIVEIISLANTHVVFANASEYLFTVSIVGEVVPIEKIALILLFPAWVLLMHEWLLDDQL